MNCNLIFSNKNEKWFDEIEGEVNLHELFLVLEFYLNSVYEVFQQHHHNPKQLIRNIHLSRKKKPREEWKELDFCY